jgi:hypothetical protein
MEHIVEAQELHESLSVTGKHRLDFPLFAVDNELHFSHNVVDCLHAVGSKLSSSLSPPM